jgi:glycosyltransferase involved in cell wall biosynthesis
MVPRVSVVMAARNEERFVEAAVRSALGQTFSDLEVIVVDDGSTDRTAGIVERIDDPRLHLIRIPQTGSAAARNVGLRAARGEFIAFLDADDMWDAEKTAAHLDLMESLPDVDLTFSQSRLIDESGARLHLPVRRPRGSYDFSSLLRDNVIGNGSAVVVRRSAIPMDGFNESLKSCIDYELWLRIAMIRPGNAVCLPVVCTSYRRHSGQVTGNWRQMRAGWELMIARMRKLAPAETAAVESAARANWYRYLSFVAFEAGERREAKNLLAQSFKSGPVVAALNVRTWLLASAIAASRVPAFAFGAMIYGLSTVSRRGL